MLRSVGTAGMGYGERYMLGAMMNNIYSWWERRIQHHSGQVSC